VKGGTHVALDMANYEPIWEPLVGVGGGSLVWLRCVCMCSERGWGAQDDAVAEAASKRAWEVVEKGDDVEAMKAELANGANLRREYNNDMSSYFNLARYERVAILRHLLSVDPQLSTAVIDYGYTLLHPAGENEVLKVGCGCALCARCCNTPLAKIMLLFGMVMLLILCQLRVFSLLGHVLHVWGCPQYLSVLRCFCICVVWVLTPTVNGMVYVWTWLVPWTRRYICFVQLLLSCPLVRVRLSVVSGKSKGSLGLVCLQDSMHHLVESVLWVCG